ncbi:GNAT family N-acetyltransferase [Aureimonas sp. AU20]|uniref:GNAT family N-acetyltransferase n=1 Tax=Aureimonas sp. AU20 TaxID=1349819 RepID=UPI0007225846|nr:GNAT family N-acetyltransferase [Aureimonas sp. AU20]ALN74799.1 hypothetical protein M673_18925 [Aureimonas sp. AU20]
MSTASPIAAIRLAPVAPADRDRLAALAVAPDQAGFVASNAASLEEADEDPDARPRALWLSDGPGSAERLVGFLMYEAPSGDTEARIYRLMIDRAEQGRGLGKAALQAVLGEIRALAHIQEISICYDPGNAAARHMYGQAGFVEEGLDEDGEMIARLLWPKI